MVNDIKTVLLGQAVWIIPALLDTADEGTTVIWNAAGYCSPSSILSRPWRLESSDD